jgi:hypothetical protein
MLLQGRSWFRFRVPIVLRTNRGGERTQSMI